ncbi:MAG: ProQ/FinO family protein [Methylobacter sp.]
MSFSFNAKPPKCPLKLVSTKILEQVDKLGTHKNDLRAAIKSWCWSNRYWDCLTEDAVRADLNENAAGQVTKVDADQARKLKVGRRKKSEVVGALPTEGILVLFIQVPLRIIGH